MRTRLSVCRRKKRFESEADAVAMVARSGLPLHVYRCDRCHQFHLTSRTKGRRLPSPAN